MHFPDAVTGRALAAGTTPTADWLVLASAAAPRRLVYGHRYNRDPQGTATRFRWNVQGARNGFESAFSLDGVLGVVVDVFRAGVNRF